MTIRYKVSFTRDLSRLNDADLIRRIQQAVESVQQAVESVQQAVESVQQAEKLQDIPNLIKMQGGRRLLPAQSGRVPALHEFGR